MPALWSCASLGSIALLGAIPCIVLALGEADQRDDLEHREAFTAWAAWSGALLAVVLVCTAVFVALAALNRRWTADVGAALPRVSFGDRGPAVRITTRQQRRRARRSRQATDWWHLGGSIIAGGGGALIFLGLYVHQPGLRADRVSYPASTEAVIGGIVLSGGGLLFIGLVALLMVDGLMLFRKVSALRRTVRRPDQATPADRRLARVAMSAVITSCDGALMVWTAVTVLGLGSALGTGNVAAFILPLALWTIVGSVLAAARWKAENIAPLIRNSVGYELPSQPDSSEFPDINLHGQ
ncbi:hypothetical protein [Arthrobacter sp. NPDC090010]|uniref:hypothetical protein n=1 Tax=Arthrobacter sp. NPDC090010 TaxID=3363942 RepID=UPI0037F9F188